MHLYAPNPQRTQRTDAVSAQLSQNPNTQETLKDSSSKQCVVRSFDSGQASITLRSSNRRSCSCPTDNRRLEAQKKETDQQEYGKLSISRIGLLLTVLNALLIIVSRFVLLLQVHCVCKSHHGQPV